MTPIRAYMLIVDGEPSLEDIYPYEEEALHQKHELRVGGQYWNVEVVEVEIHAV